MIQARYGRPDFPEGIRNLTTPDEIGAAVVFLASTPGRKINGVILYLDSGLHIADDAGHGLSARAQSVRRSNNASTN